MSNRAKTLDYRAPDLGRSERWSVGKPISCSFAIALFVLWTWPVLLSMGSVDLLYMRPVLHGYVFVGLGFLVYLCFMARWFWMNRRKERATADEERAAWTRLAAVCLTSAIVIGVHASGLPLLLLFLAHRSSFETARLKATATLAPGTTAKHGRIGLFPIVAVERGMAGGVAFKVDGGSGFQHGGETLLVPPGTGGPLVGGWRWEATD